jgi:hypothetical protein
MAQWLTRCAKSAEGTDRRIRRGIGVLGVSSLNQQSTISSLTSSILAELRRNLLANARVELLHAQAPHGLGTNNPGFLLG